MQQIALVIGGERDYTMIKGDTGPLVYPALHVWIYRALYDMTFEGRSIVLAEVIFAILYCINLLLVMGCYRQARVGIPSRDQHLSITDDRRRPHMFFRFSFSARDYTASTFFDASMTALLPHSCSPQSTFFKSDSGRLELSPSRQVLL